MTDEGSPEPGSEPLEPSTQAGATGATTEIEDASGERFVVPSSVPLLPVRDMVVYPGVTVPLTIGRPK